MSLEIERKFLVSVSPDWSLPIFRSAQLIKYEQVYLYVSDAEQKRIRSSTSNGSTAYHFAYLRRLDTGVREVTERQLDRNEYECLREHRDPARQIIYKDRYSFHWRGRLLELDNIIKPTTRACHLLEIQVTDLSESIELPDFLSIDREVTAEPTYSNAIIALG